MVHDVDAVAEPGAELGDDGVGRSVGGEDQVYALGAADRIGVALVEEVQREAGAGGAPKPARESNGRRSGGRTIP